MEQFAELLNDVALSINPDSRSKFFALFYGQEWDILVKMQTDLNEQVELLKKMSKGSLATFDFFLQKGSNMARDSGLVKGGNIPPTLIPQ